MIMGELTLAGIPVAVHLEAEKIAGWVQVGQGTSPDPTGLSRALAVAPGLEMQDLHFVGCCWGEHLMVGCFLMGEARMFPVLLPSSFEACLKPTGVFVFPLGCRWQWDAASEHTARDASAPRGKWDSGSRACPRR